MSFIDRLAKDKVYFRAGARSKTLGWPQQTQPQNIGVAAGVAAIKEPQNIGVAAATLATPVPPALPPILLHLSQKLVCHQIICKSAQTEIKSF